jgi:hypothetical protein
MNLIMFNFVQLSSKKLEKIVNGEKRDRRLKDCFQRNDDLQLDKLLMTMNSVAEQCLPSLTRTLLIWHESQMSNLSYLKQQMPHSEFNAFSLTATTKITLKTKQLVNQAKIENEILDERKELVIHSLLCVALIEILKQLPFHPGNDDLLNYIIDLCFKRFLSKENPQLSNPQLFSDSQYVTDLHAEVIGTIAQSRFSLVKRRFLIEFKQLKLNISPLPIITIPPSSVNNSANLVVNNAAAATPVSPSAAAILASGTSPSSSNNSSVVADQQWFAVNPGSINTVIAQTHPQQETTATTTSTSLSTSNANITNLISPTSANTIKLLMGMKYFRIKMVPIEDFEASFLFLNDCAQYFVDVKDRDIKHTLAGLFVEILVPIIGTVKNEVNIPCLKTFVDILYPHAIELSSKSKHRLATFPLLTCLLCVSQKHFFLAYWFQFAQSCLQQFKAKEQTLARISLESILRLVWVYMIRIKGEKSSETNQRLLAILQALFPKGQKIVQPKEMPANIFIKIIEYMAYEKLDWTMKEVVYELLSIDVNSSYDNSNSSSNSNNNISNAAAAAATEHESYPVNNISSLYNNLNNTYNNNANPSEAAATAAAAMSNNSSNGNMSSQAFKQSKENLVINPFRMEIGLRAFIHISDTMQFQKENGLSAPIMPATFNTAQSGDILSSYLTSTTTTKTPPHKTSILTDSLAREIGLNNYFEHIRRSFQDILKTLDCTVGRTFLMTRPDNTQFPWANDPATSMIDSAHASLNLNSSTGNSNSNSSQAVLLSGSAGASTSSIVANVAVNLLTTAQSAANSVVTAAEAFVPSSLHHFNLHSSTIGGNNVDLNDTNIQMSNNLSQIQNNIFTVDNKSKLNLLKVCISLIPRMMPLFKESELVEILTRLTIHLDEELKMIAFQTLKTFVNEMPQWRKWVFIGFTNFILKEISDMHPKLIETALKMLIQLLNTWKVQLVKDLKVSTNPITSKQLNDDYSQIVFHLEGFSLFTLCHSQIQRRRYALLILRECKVIGELVKCFRFYPYHNYAIDILDLASIHAMKQLHLQCFNSGLIVNNTKPDLAYLIEQSASWETSVNTASYNSTNEAMTTSATITQNSNIQIANNSTSSSTSTFYNIINKSNRTSSVSNQYQSEPDPPPNESEKGETYADNDNENYHQPSSGVQSNQSSNPQGAGLLTTGGSMPHSSINGFTTASSTPTAAAATAASSATSNSNSNVFTFDPWTECLAIFFSYDFIFTKCPQSRVDAWPFIYTRLQQLLTFVDPNEQPHETSRTSILFGVGANSLEKIRRAANEREVSLNLWKNYLIGACCLAYGSDRHFFYPEYERALLKTDTENSQSILSDAVVTAAQNNYQQSSAANTSMNVEFTIVESTSKFYATFGTGTSLIKMIVPFLKCECNYFREIVIRGLGRINIEALRDLVDELVPYIKDCLDKRQEKLRRMKKRDVVRLAIIRIFELMAEQRTLGKRLVDTSKRPKSAHLKSMHPQVAQQYINEEQNFKKTFNDYVDNMHAYLDQESSTTADSNKNSSDLTLQIRLHFSNFLHKLIDSVHRDKRSLLFSSATRVNLFNLCDKWSGRFSLTQQQQHSYSSNINSQSIGSGLLSLSFKSSNSLHQQQQQQTSGPSFNQTNPNQFYVHHSHYHHHKCYHYYEELELAATKACAEILCCGDTFDRLSNANSNSGSPNSTMNTKSPSYSSSVVFTWLSQLLENANTEMKMYDACKCALPNEIYMLSLNVCIQLLDLSLNKNIVGNSNNNVKTASTIESAYNGNLIFEWIIQKCYSSISQEIADLCFIALAKVYIEYSNQNLMNNKNKAKTPEQQQQQPPAGSTSLEKQSFDFIYLSPILTLAILNIGSSRLNIHETSICLLRMINRCHLQDNYTTVSEKPADNVNAKMFANLDAPPIDSSLSSSSPKVAKEPPTNNNNNWNSPASLLLNIDFDIINSMAIYSKSQLFISEYLAKKNPEQTMFIFCEITSRFESCASHHVRRTMLSVLVPWFYNLELIDSNVVDAKSSPACDNLNTTGLGFLPLQTGYGTAEATQIILNNLFYLTCKFGEEYSAEFELLWAILASTWKSNLKIACRFLFIMVSLASYEMVVHVKRVICYLSKTCPERLVDELVIELECMDSFVTVLDKCENVMPFYRYNRPVPVPLVPPKQQEKQQINNEKKSKRNSGHKSRTYFVNKVETNENDSNNTANSSIFMNEENSQDDDDEDDEDNDDDQDNSDDDDDDEEDDDDDEEDEEDHEGEDDEEEYEEYQNNYENDEWTNRLKSFADEEIQNDETQYDSNSDIDDENDKEKKLFSQLNSNDNSDMSKKKRANKQRKSTSPRKQQQCGAKSASSTTTKGGLLIETSALPNPTHLKSYACPLNVILFHLGHSHRQQSHAHQHYPHIYSYHNNYYHQNHYHHISMLSRGGIALMLFSELLSTDGADFDWTAHLPFLFHYCLINFDNTKPIIGEHAKNLFLNILYILTVQNELYSLTDFIIESMDSIIDNQSIIFDRKYTNNNLLESSSSIFSGLASSRVKLSPGNCHYNYNFNSRVFSSHLKGYSNHHSVKLGNSSALTSHRALINTHSAPSSPANTQNSKGGCGESQLVSSPTQDLTNNGGGASSGVGNTKKSTLINMGKRCNKIQKAKDHLAAMLGILARCKNSPVWPYELITCQNYSIQMTSVQILNEFVSNLQEFLRLCFSTKHVSTISSSSTRSFSSPLNLTRFSLNEKSLNNIDKKWSQYALNSSLNTTSRHYAGRSLQIYRALGIKFNSFSTMVNLAQRLMDTVADSSEDVQGYVTEMLLTLKMNANLFAFQYLKTLNELTSFTKTVAPQANVAFKNKSKSLKQDRANQEKKLIEQKKKSATAVITSDLIKSKTATLSRRLTSENTCQTKVSKSSTKYKHQIAYKKSLTLSLFNLKWQILEDRIGRGGAGLNNGRHVFQGNLNLNKSSYSSKKVASQSSNSGAGKNGDNLRTLVKIFWTCICLLESDFEHEFVLAIEIMEQILSKIDLNSGVASNGQLLVHKNEFRTHLELFLFKMDWPDFPGLQNLLLKGCTSSTEKTLEATHRLLVQLIPYCSKLNFVDPYGMSYYGLWGISMNLLALLPTLIYNYEKPTDMCMQAAELFCKVLKDQIRMLEEQQPRQQQQQQQQAHLSHTTIQKSNKIEQLKCLVHVMNLYSTNSFGKDRSQWTKCVITYLSEFFQFCQNEQIGESGTTSAWIGGQQQNGLDQQQEQTSSKSNNFYFNWIVFLTELLDKHGHNPGYQSCVFLCLNSLLNFISFTDRATWSFINEELMRTITKYVNSPLWSEALDLIKLTVSKSSSLTDANTNLKTTTTSKISDKAADLGGMSSVNFSSQVPVSSQNFFGKKELPGRTLEFDFDFSLFVPSNQDQIKMSSPNQRTTTTQVTAPVNGNSKSTKQQTQQQQQTQSQHNQAPQQLPPLSLINFHTNKQFHYVNQHLIGLGTTNISGWKCPQLSQNKTRQRIYLLLNSLTKHQSQTNVNAHGSSLVVINNGVPNIAVDTTETLSINHISATGTTSASTSSSSIHKSLLQFENSNSLNNSSTTSATQRQQLSSENLNSTNNTTQSNSGNPKCVSINITSPIIDKTLASPLSAVNSSANSSTSATSSSNMNSSLNVAMSNSSSNSLNQTSFITSPTTTRPLLKTALTVPSLTVPSSSDSGSNSGNMLRSHSRQNSRTSFGLPSVGINMKPVEILTTNPTSSTTTMHGRMKSSMDDNNFINNTFSFLDDLDSVSEFGSRSSGINKPLQPLPPTPTPIQRPLSTSSSPQPENALLPKTSPVANDDENENENFPWHAIYPVTSASESRYELDKSQSLLYNNTDQDNKSRTLPNHKFHMASNSFTANDEKTEKLSFYGGGSISSKSKPMAPIIKTQSATIGVASGVEALKKMNIFSINNSKQSMEIHDDANADSCSSLSSVSSVKNNEKTISSSSGAGPGAQNDERRPSITRIIKSDSFQTATTPSSPSKPIAPQKPIAPNASVSSSSSISVPISNILYEHHPDKLIKTSQAPANPPLTQATNFVESFFQSKRNALKGSSVNNLSNLLAQDDKKLCTTIPQKMATSPSSYPVNNAPVNGLIKNSNSTSSIKSMTLPSGGKSSSIGKSSSSAHNNMSPSIRTTILKSPFGGTTLNKINSASDSSIQESSSSSSNAKANDLIKKTHSLFNACSPFINLLNIIPRDIEDAWKSHVTSVFDKNKNNKSVVSTQPEHVNLLETFLLFKKLFKESRRHLSGLLFESCSVLSTNNTVVFTLINKHFANIIELLNRRLKCPLVYFDQNLLVHQIPVNGASGDSVSSAAFTPNYSIVNKHRQVVWEIGENFETFVNLRKEAYETLESLKKLERSIGTFVIDAKSKLERKKRDLSKKVSKLISQLMLILQSFAKLLPNLTQTLAQMQVTDKSEELNQLYKSLVEASQKLQAEKLVPFLSKNQQTAISVNAHNFLPNSKELFVHLILESIRKENYPIAIECFKLAQSYWPSEFSKGGQTDEFDIDFILFLVCENERLKNSNMIAIIEDDDKNFNETIQTILLENIEISNVISILDKRLKENNTGVLTDEEIEC